MAISPDNEQYINHVVSLGMFENREQVLNEAVRMLRQRETLREELAIGREQLNEGDYREFDTNGLRAYFDMLKNRARSKAERSNDA